MKNYKMDYEGNHIVAYNKLIFETFPRVLFDSDYLKSNSLLISGDKILHGRGNIYGFEYNGHLLVLRHYHRGGMMAKIIDDEYLWTGLDSSRPIRELTMLDEMQDLGLPVPIPVAARISRSGISYRADIITKLIPNTKALSSCLEEEALSESTWYQIGRTIKKFHEHNCNHADLNAHNILLNENNEIFLIDLSAR